MGSIDRCRCCPFPPLGCDWRDDLRREVVSRLALRLRTTGSESFTACIESMERSKVSVAMLSRPGEECVHRDTHKSVATTAISITKTAIAPMRSCLVIEKNVFH